MRERLLRADVVVAVRAGGAGTAIADAGRHGSSEVKLGKPRAPLEIVDRAWLDRIAAALVELGHPPQVDESDPGTVFVPRIALEIRDADLATYGWEDLLRSAVERAGIRCPIVRVSPVRSRLAERPLTLPVRLAIVDTRASDLTASIREGFAHFPPEEAAVAFDVQELTFSDFSDFREQAKWPTAEVLHFGFGRKWRNSAALSTAEPEREATLGWLLRITGTWQTRLVLFECDEDELHSARGIANALAGKGGPAVVVAPRSLDFRHFYWALIHDHAIDEAIVPLDPVGPRPVLFGGGGREDALRVSTVAFNLVTLTKELNADLDEGAKGGVVSEVLDVVTRRTRYRALRRHPLHAVDEVGATLSEGVLRPWDEIRFREHESGGLIPVARTLGRVRTITSSRPVATPRPKEKGARYVNSRLASMRADGVLNPIPQHHADACLQLDKVYQLALQIGPRDHTVKVYGASALLEEHFDWGAGVEGRWLEIGLTALDFDVLGDPVQEIWLPKEGPSDEIAFAVAPTRKGVSRLRFCVYVDQCLLQSFRLAAITFDPLDEIDPKEARADLARALDISTKNVGDAGYMARLEYAAVSSAESMLESPKRTLSVFANDLDGGSVITIKGRGEFSVGTSTDLPQYVANARSALERAALAEGSTEESPRYAFDDTTNAGDEAQLREILKALAQTGWTLFATIAPDKTQEIASSLEGKRGVIRAGHLLLEKVIPWGLVYDRMYRIRKTIGGKPAANDACLAPLAFPKDTQVGCGEHPECLLHPEREKAREDAGEPVLRKETVACPLHLWGFRHVIESPPLQVAHSEDPVEPENCIAVDPPSRVNAATNRTLALADSHRKALEALCQELGISAGLVMAEERDEVLDKLLDSPANVVYMYCHAVRRIPGAGGDIPQLVFPYADKSEGLISATDLAGGGKWTNGPLIFLNGCRTAGFSPDALSPFIEMFVKGRGAGGVLGTEVPVWEQVATDVALRFLALFLKGAPAGLALLEARRSLFVEKRNPLGLAYTLYGSADLALDLDGDGICEKTPVAE